MDFEELDWPVQSPDLYPIEHLWDELERRLRARPKRPTSAAELTSILLKEWCGIPAATFQKLVDSLPNEWQPSLQQNVAPLHTNS